MGDKEYRIMFGKSREEAVNESKAELREAMKGKDKTKIKKAIDKLMKTFIGDDALYSNEVAANYNTALVMVMISLIMIVSVILAACGVYTVSASGMLPLFLICIAQMIAGIVLCFVFHGEAVWLKYLLTFLVCVTVMATSSLLGYRIAISICLPLVLSIRYFNERLSRAIAVISGVMMLTSTIGFAIFGLSYDLNSFPFAPGIAIEISSTVREATSGVDVDLGQYIENLLLRSFLPEVMQYIMISVVCVKIAKWGHRTVLQQAEASREFSRIDTELSLATNIQAHMLPSIFPAFPDRPEFDIYAKMDPAKEVGGDFYDFFLVDGDHLGIVMADVSGKGVPAALFMMIGKTLIKNQAQLGKGPAAILETVNAQLCENNEDQLFITAWVGVLTISTGELRAANAGHEYPVIKHANGTYEAYKDKHGFVLAGMSGSRYKEYAIHLQRGDSLFVYTDGVTEATNSSGQLFGMDRLLESLNSLDIKDQKDLLTALRATIDRFVGDAEQFDDITMLGLRYDGPHGKYLTVDAKVSNIPDVTAWVDNQLEEVNCLPKAQMQIDIAIDELFSNIANYAYGDSQGKATIRFYYLEDEESIELIFEDQGRPYNPLENKDPDTTLSAEERGIGGLGVFLVKKTMDKMDYVYDQCSNRLTIKKKIH